MTDDIRQAIHVGGVKLAPPTSDSPDPVGRLERELERLNGDYAKLYGVVREYIACEKHPQIRGEAYRDLRGTYDLLSGADADQGWPACYQRIVKQLDEANKRSDEDAAELTARLAEAEAENKRLRLHNMDLREVASEHGLVYRDDNDQLRFSDSGDLVGKEG